MISNRDELIANNRDSLIATIYYANRGTGMTDYTQVPPNYSLDKVTCHPEAFLSKVFTCGCSLTYETEYDIPEKSVKCKHGIKLIEYLDV